MIAGAAISQLQHDNTLDSTLPTGRLFCLSDMLCYFSFSSSCFTHIAFVFCPSALPEITTCLHQLCALPPPSLQHLCHQAFLILWIHLAKCFRVLQLKSPTFLLQPPQLSHLSKSELSLLPSTWSSHINLLKLPKPDCLLLGHENIFTNRNNWHNLVQ